MRVKRALLKTAIIRILLGAILISGSIGEFNLKDALSKSSFIPEFQKGMCYAAWQKNKYTSSFSDLSLKSLARTGTEWVSIITTWYQEDVSSTEIKRTEKTPSDSSLEHAVRQAHKLGMRVMLKPHVDLFNTKDGYWRVDIFCESDEDRVKWLRSYKKFILHYATLAQENGVEMFCVGTELSSTTMNTDMWRDIIRSVRRVYHGPLVYAANWDEYRDVNFWDDLDYVGIDAYFPLSDKDHPTREDIKAGWKRWLDDLEPWAMSIEKPVVFTEAGYSSTIGVARTPWEERNPGGADVEAQRRCYEALFETLWDREWFYGVYWWRWSTNHRAGGINNRGFTPQNKPAERTLVEWYNKRSGQALHNPSE